MSSVSGRANLTLRDVVDTPELGIRPLHVGSGGLDQAVGWAYTTDLPDPSRYLSPGLLVMTGLMWRREPDDSDPWVQYLVDAGVTALMAGEGLLGHVPDDVVEACRTHDLTLLAVTASVSFVDITEHITGRLTDDRVTRLTATLIRRRHLLTEVAAGQALDEVVLQVSRESGLLAWIITATGRLVVSGGGLLADADIDALTAAAVSRAELPTTVEGSDAVYSVFGIPGGSASRLRGWYLAIRGDHTTWPAGVLDAMRELCAIAALDKVRDESSREAWHEITDATFAILARDGDSLDGAAHLAQIGVDMNSPVMVIAARFESARDRRDDARWLLTDAVSAIGRPVVGFGSQHDVVALVAVDRQHSTDRALAALTAALERVAPGLAGDRLTVGVSQPGPVEALGGAVRSARYARQVAGDTRKPVEVILSSEVDSALLLLNSVPDTLRRTYAEHVLGAVVEYDARGGAELLSTLRAYFDCTGSWSRTAERLDLHLNTVRYRIARVEKLTGRDLGRMEDRMDLYLALHLL